MLVEFYEFNFKLLLFFLYPIFRIIQDYTYEAYIKEDKDNNLFTTFRCYLSFIFGGIPYIVYKIKTKRTKKEVEIDEKELCVDLDGECEDKKDYGLSQVEIVEREMEKMKILKNILYQSLLSIIGLFSFFFGYYFKKKEYSNAKYSFRPFVQIANFTALSYFLLQQKIYKHHLVSYGCIILMLIIIFIVSFQYLKEILFSVLYYFISELVYAIYDVLIKRYMVLYFKSPYFIMFYLGIIITILFLIYDTIAFFVNQDVSGIIIGFRDNINSFGDFFFFFLDLIFVYIWNLGIWVIIDIFTPCHYFISDYLSESIYFILKRFQKKDQFYKSNVSYSSIIICNFFIFIFCLVFNEVIILNFWGLDYNTKKRINERLTQECNPETLKLEMTRKTKDTLSEGSSSNNS